MALTTSPELLRCVTPRDPRPPVCYPVVWGSRGEVIVVRSGWVDPGTSGPLECACVSEIGRDSGLGRKGFVERVGRHLFPLTRGSLPPSTERQKREEEKGKEGRDKGRTLEPSLP